MLVCVPRAGSVCQAGVCVGAAAACLRRGPSGSFHQHRPVVTFPPVLVSAHEDGCVRFWDLEGELLTSAAPEGRSSGNSLTALCADADAAVLLVGDKRGYLTQFEVGKFLERPRPDPESGAAPHEPSQTVFWRAHLSKVIFHSFFKVCPNMLACDL